MRIRALVPALGLAAALVAPPALLAGPDHDRSRDRGRRSAYDRSSRDHRDAYRFGQRSDSRGYQRGYSHGYHRGSARGHHRRDHWYPRHGHRPYPVYRPYLRPYSRPYYYRYRPVPPAYYVPHPVPYGVPVAPPPYHRHGVHGGISIGVPGFGLSLFF